MVEGARRTKLLDGLVARCTDPKRKKKWADQDRQRVIAGERMTNIISREEADLLNKLICLSFSKSILSILPDDIAGVTEEQKRFQIEHTLQKAGRNVKKEQERVHQLTERLMPEWKSAFEQLRLEYGRRLANYTSELRNQADVDTMLRREFEVARKDYKASR